IDEAFALQVVQRRPRPFSTQGEWQITLFVNSSNGVRVSFDKARMHGCADLQLGRDKVRLLIVLEMDADATITGVDFEFLTPDTARQIGEEALRPIRHALFRSRQRGR